MIAQMHYSKRSKDRSKIALKNVVLYMRFFRNSPHTSKKKLTKKGGLAIKMPYFTKKIK